MKTKILIEIETDDKYNVVSKEFIGKEEEEMSDSEKQEKETYTNSYPNWLHNHVVSMLKTYIEDGNFEENVLDNIEDCYVDTWETFEDYGIKVKLSNQD